MLPSLSSCSSRYFNVLYDRIYLFPCNRDQAHRRFDIHFKVNESSVTNDDCELQRRKDSKNRMTGVPPLTIPDVEISGTEVSASDRGKSDAMLLRSVFGAQAYVYYQSCVVDYVLCMIYFSVVSHVIFIARIRTCFFIQSRK